MSFDEYCAVSNSFTDRREDEVVVPNMAPIKKSVKSRHSKRQVDGNPALVRTLLRRLLQQRQELQEQVQAQVQTEQADDAIS